MSTGDLFEFGDQGEKRDDPSAALSPSLVGPLAHRMRPRNLSDLIGHDKILGPDRPLRQWIESDRVPSLIFWGPPGSGKTTLAQIIARSTHCAFISLSAVMGGVKDIKEAVEKAERLRALHKRKTILFVDEIHRFNKSQQDALLPHVESGTLTLIGATTENPSFELNRALLSRARVIRLELLTAQDLEKILRRALLDPERGLAGTLEISDEAILWLASHSEGDARRALTALETLSLHSRLGGEPLTLQEVQTTLEKQPIPYDKHGEEHYNVISAFIKSLRDSDADAGLYYLARMLEGGEDPLFIARRLVILASEDVGNADPRGLQIAIAAQQAVDFIGMPEARICLAQAVTYLAKAPKSNASYVGINEALAEVRETGALPVPMHLRNAVTSLMKNEGYGKGYQYAHDRPDAKVNQEHLPEKLQGRQFYRPKSIGYEKHFVKGD